MDSSRAAEAAPNAMPSTTRPGPRPLLPLVLLALGLIAVPVLGDGFLAYQVALFLIYGIATQGVALCWGRLGFLPLGQSLFFGLGAYLAGGALKAAEAQTGWILALPLAVLLPALLAYALARLVFARSQRSGPYFSLITLAAAMLGFLVAQQWSSVTGGFNGLSGVPDMPGTERFSTLYWVVAAAALASTALLGALLRRPIGVLWHAIAQDEERLQLFGYATDRMKAAAFALAAALAALAGGLFAAHQGIVTPVAMGFVLATEFVIWAAVGGKLSPLGALLGAVVVGYASSELRDRIAFWEVLVALVFILVVRYLPDGLAGLVATLRARRAAAPAEGPRTPAPARRAPVSGLSLAIDELSVAQNGVRILDGLSLDLQGPGIRAVIGPNGAGKTSSFNALTGRLPVRGGRLRLGGEDVTGWPTWRVAAQGVGRKMQVPTVFRELSVRDNLLIAVWAGRLSARDALGLAAHRWTTPLQDELLARFPALREQWGVPAGALSQGHRQALEFLMTVLPEPGLVLLDEPCAGLSSAETRHMAEAIQAAVRRLGAAALLIEHDIDAVAALADEVFVLHQGRLLARGSLREVQADPRVRAVYAGGHK
ncbi:branched-chain amino acid ABC transporter ATP-binding protein/permease [Hydrogenophaga borbori]